MGLFGKSKKAEDRAIKYNFKEDPDDLKNQIKNIMDLGRLYTRNEDYASAKEQFDSAFEILKQMECYPRSYDGRSLLGLRWQITSGLSYVYYFKGDIASALDGRLQEKQLRLQIRELDTRANPELAIYDVKQLIIVNTSIADCYRQLKDYQNALEYASEALVQCTEATKKWGLLEFADCYFSSDAAMAFILYDMGDFEKALTYCQEFINICEMLPEYLKTKEGKDCYKQMIKLHDLFQETVTDT